jgi:hypothetical protein
MAEKNSLYGPLCSLYYDLDDVHGAVKELPFYRVYTQKAEYIV